MYVCMYIYIYIYIYINYPSFLSDFNEMGNFSTGFGRYLNIKFHKNPAIGSRVFKCERTDKQT